MKKGLLLTAFFAALCLFSGAQINIKNVNPFIGTGGHGHTHPAATAPFGLVQLGPDTRLTGWDGCSGYHYTDTAIYGFSHTHLSGTGVSDYGDILFRPITSESGAVVNEAIPFNKADESAEAGVYRVTLANGVICSFTASTRTGIHRYEFPKGERALLFLDLLHRDKATSMKFEAHSDTSFSGHRYSEAWATNQKVHFAGVTNLPFEVKPGSVKGTWILDFGVIDTPIEMQVGLSGCDEEGAGKNLKTERETFARQVERTHAMWNKELYKTEVWGGSDDDRTIFATALYHAYSVPNMWSDVDGRYRGMDDKIHQDPDHNHYTIFSLWDTYRTAHPFYAITQPKRTADFIATMLDQFDQYGRLPIWELAANETNCMIGYHSVSVLADAVAKGYKIDDPDRLLNAMDQTAKASLFGLDEYRKYGFLSIQDESESVSKTLEYAYDDACIAWTAEHFGDEDLANTYRYRSSAYRSVTELSSGLVRPRDNGDFLELTNPREVNSHFTEANAWQYSFSPVHDLDGWMRLLGDGHVEKGRQRLEANLDSLFVQPSETTGRDQADITGLIGQYAHGNEPSHHIAFLYNATHSPWKGQARVHEIIEKFYQNAPDGLSGNEDCGQMSAWYIMASMGIYPLVPGKPEYVLTAPIWDSVRVDFAHGHSLQIKKKGRGPYIQSLQVDGEPFDQNWITHEQFHKGGEWIVECGPEPSGWGSKKPYSTDMKSSVLPAPIINAPRRFTDQTEIVFQPATHHNTTEILDGEGQEVDLEGDGVTITETAAFSARFVDHTSGEAGHISRTLVTKKPGLWEADLTEGEMNPQYTAGGVSALVDGIYGDLDWRKGDWIGVQGQDMTVELVHPTPTEITKVEVSLLKDIKSWIGLPQNVELAIWEKEKWKVIETIDLGEKPRSEESSSIEKIVFENFKKTKTAKLRITMTNPGKLLDWHPGVGGETFIFIDEISVN